MENLDGKEFYNEMHKNTPNRWDVEAGWHPFDANIKNILYAFFKTKPISIIDLGCGNGRTLKFIEAPNIKSVGVDYSEEAIKLAKENCPQNQFYCEHMTNTGFTSNSFDAVISVGAFEHQEILDFSEPRRLVKDSGWFLAVLPDTPETKGLTLASDGLHYDWQLVKEDWIKIVEKFNFIFQDYINPWTFVFKPI